MLSLPPLVWKTIGFQAAWCENLKKSVNQLLPTVAKNYQK
jgi:hypothetical protein